MKRYTQRKITLQVTLEAPDGANLNQVRDYVAAAIRSHCGGLNPAEDPMFDLNRDSVKVSVRNMVSTVSYE